MMARVEQANVDEETRVEAVNAAVAFYKRVGRKDAERMALDGLADLRGQTPKIRSGSGKALLGCAGAAYRAGRVVEARAQILAARDDLQKAGDPLALVAWISLGRIEIGCRRLSHGARSVRRGRETPGGPRRRGVRSLA